MTLMFFYGTLMTGCFNHARFLLANVSPVNGLSFSRLKARLVARAQTDTPMTMYVDGAVPFVTELPATTPIKGELWEVPEDRADEISALERSAGYTQLRVIVKCGAYLQHGYSALMYVTPSVNRAGTAKVVPDGDYLKWLTTARAEEVVRA